MKIWLSRAGLLLLMLASQAQAYQKTENLFMPATGVALVSFEGSNIYATAPGILVGDYLIVGIPTAITDSNYELQSVEVQRGQFELVSNIALKSSWIPILGGKKGERFLILKALKPVLESSYRTTQIKITYKPSPQSSTAAIYTVYVTVNEQNNN